MTFRVSGDLGDVAFVGGVVNSIPGKHSIFFTDRPGITGPFTNRSHLLKPLFEAQDYIASAENTENEPDVDLVMFRRWHSSSTTLVAANASEYSFQTGNPCAATGQEPWMKVVPNKDFNGKIIVARSPRYQNRRFPFKKIVEHYGHRLIFVGIPDEHAAFCSDFGLIPHLQVKDFLELAKAIAGASLFIGNQSSPQAVAMAIGATIIQETCDYQPDCIFNRENVQYVCDGGVTLPDVSGSGSRHIPAVVDITATFNTQLVPPGMWKYIGLPDSPHFSLQVEFVEKLEHCSKKEAERKLYDFNAKREPQFFHGGSQNDPMALYNVAMKNAFPSLAKPL